MKRVRIARNGYFLMSILFCMTGFIYISMPRIPSLAFCIAGGILLIIYGIIKIIGYLSDDLYNLAFQYDLGCGLFLIVLGMIVLVCNMRIQDHLYQGMGCLILLDSLLTIQTCGDAKKFGLETWYRILGFSIMTGIFGVLTIIKPFEAGMLSRAVAGCALLAEGFVKQYVVRCTVKKQ